jgi:hypothetical protein
LVVQLEGESRERSRAWAVPVEGEEAEVMRGRQTGHQC